jgi:ribonuclease HI
LIPKASSVFRNENRGETDEVIYLNFDGLCEPRNPGGIATYGVVVSSGKIHLMEDGGLALAEPWSEEASNNVAEYSALIKGLEWLKSQGYSSHKIVIRGDSRLVINQLNGTFKVKAPRIVELYKRAKDLLDEFSDVRMSWIDRSENKEADLLSRIAYSKCRKIYPGTSLKRGR